MHRGRLNLKSKPDFNIIIFLVLYFVLKYGFYLYVGFTTPGGKLYFSFFGSYANFPGWLTIFVSKTSAFLLKISGYSVHQLGNANITIAGSKGVTIAWGCLGIGAISLWLGFIIAHRIRLKYKLKWITIGAAIIFAINIFRIDMIALSNYYKWSYFQNFNAHTSFDTLTYVIILGMMTIFVMRYDKKKKAIADNV